MCVVTFGKPVLKLPCYDGIVEHTYESIKMLLATSKYTCIFKGYGQLLAQSFALLVAAARNGTHCFKNLRVDSSHHNLDYFEKAGTSKQACRC